MLSHFLDVSEDSSSCYGWNKHLLQFLLVKQEQLAWPFDFVVREDVAYMTHSQVTDDLVRSAELPEGQLTSRSPGFGNQTASLDHFVGAERATRPASHFD